MVAFMVGGRGEAKGCDIETIQRRWKEQPLSYSSFVVVLVLEHLFGSPHRGYQRSRTRTTTRTSTRGYVLRDQQNLERLVSLLHHLEAFLVLLQRKLMRDHAFGRDAAIRDPRNHKRILIGAEVNPEYIQLFAV